MNRSARRCCAGAALVLLGCGSRTGLLKPDPDPLAVPDAAPSPPVRSDCTDLSATLVYVVTIDSRLLSFDPRTNVFAPIGALACPAAFGGPFSMAVDRRGVAYVEYESGELFRVSTKTAKCEPTKWVARHDGFFKFGMGFSTDLGGPRETLYLASADLAASPGVTGGQLARVDLDTFSMENLGPFSPPLQLAELAGTGDGRLFTFYSASSTPGSTTDVHLAQVDKTTAKLLADDPLPGVQFGRGWAFGFWGGDFYLFTAPGGAGSIVTRFRPSDHSLVDVGSFGGVISGAGVSTCAPAF